MATAAILAAARAGVVAQATQVALYTTAPASSDVAGTEVTGGTYARAALSWSGSSGTASVSGAPAGTIVAGVGTYTAAGVLLSAFALASPVTLTAGAAAVTVTAS